MMMRMMITGMMRNTIKKILRESDFDWTTDLPAEDDVVYLDLTLGEPDWESVEDALEEDPEWIYWNLYLYVPKQTYRDITGQHDLSGEWDEWNVHDSREGRELLKYFYDHDFDEKQRDGLSTDVTIDNDGGFMVVDKNIFCNQVGGFHPDKCNLYNR
jgi:hypothetical protein